MRYQLQISGGENLEVDETVASKIKTALLSGDKERFVEVGKNLIRMSQIKMVSRIDEGSEQMRQYSEDVEKKVREFKERLAKYVKETPKQKAEREVRVRVRYGLKPLKLEPLFPYEDIVDFLTEWFEKHPEFPWCPFREYKNLVFNENSQVPLFFKKVVLHDHRVEEWMEENHYKTLEPKVKQEPTMIEVFDGQVPLALGRVLKGGDNK